jgi:hypothetical protein
MASAMSELAPVADDVWCVRVPSRFAGFAIGTRMTVVRLPGGGLLLHSPVPIDDALRAELDRLGPVEHIVAPNRYHHLYAGQVKALYPSATLSAARGLEKKRPDLAIDRVFDETPAPGWGDTFDLVTIDGCMLGETVLLHRPSKTLVSADLVEYFEHHEEWWTRQYLKAAGVYGEVAWNRLLKFMYRDRAAARASLDRIFGWDFDRVTIAHGDIIEHDARDRVVKSFGWLPGAW